MILPKIAASARTFASSVRTGGAPVRAGGTHTGTGGTPVGTMAFIARAALAQLRRHISAVALLVAISLSGIAPAQVLVQSTFDSDAEGWTVESFSAAALCGTPTVGSPRPQEFSWQSTGGLPGGFIRYNEPAVIQVRPLFRAPPAFLGDRSAAYGGFIRYDRRTPHQEFGRADDVYLQGSGLTLIANTAGSPNAPWGGSFAPILVGAWRLNSCSGDFATEAQIRQALQNVTALLIAAEYEDGQENEDLDNVAVVGPSPLILPVVSTFDSTSEGWFAEGQTTIGWNGTAGNPGGCISGADTINNPVFNWEFCAPIGYLGDVRAAIGTTLAFDLKAPGLSGAPLSTNPGVVRLFGADRTLQYTAPLVAGNNIWTHQRIPLTPSDAWVVISSGTRIAEMSDFDTVLRALNRISIRAEYLTNAFETDFLDNVVFGSCLPSASVLPTTCRSGAISINVSAAGSGPLAYQWRLSGIPIDAASNPSAVTATLMLANTPTLSSGPYDCVVINTCGSVTSNSTMLVYCCDSIDFNNDTSLFDPQDIEAFLSVYSEGPCVPASASCGDIDFNNDTSVFDPCDIDSFLLVFSEGPCTACGV